MLNSELFTLRLTSDDRRIISDLARYLGRNRSDALRVIIRAAHKNVPKPSAGNVEGPHNRDWPGVPEPGHVTAGAILADALPDNFQAVELPGAKPQPGNSRPLHPAEAAPA